MIVLPRDAIRQFRSVAKRCRAGRSSGPPPPVRIDAGPDAITLVATLGDGVLSLALPATGDSGTLLVPAALLDAIDGSDGDRVELHPESTRTVAVRWTDRGLPRERSFDTVPPDPRHEPPPLPASWSPVPDTVLAALHEAGRIAARESGGRYAFHRVQIQRDRIVASDSRQVLIQAGFTLPVPASGLIVPAVPLFASKEFRGHPVQIGVTGKHLVVRVGPWTVRLLRDAAGRYPDVDTVVPKCLTPSVLTVNDADAAALADALPTLPGHADENAPVTLDLAAGHAGGCVVVRAKGDEDRTAAEFALARSTATGPPVRYALDRRYLHRALTLGFRTFRFADANQPVLAVAGDRTYLAAGLHPDAALPPAKDRHRLEPPPAGLTSALATVPASVPALAPVSVPVPRSSLETRPMKNLNGSGPPAANRIEPPADDVDLLAEAEALRNSLVDIVQKVARLVAALKHQRKEKKALTQVWSSLKSLNLGP